MNIETREFDVRSVNEEERVVKGIAVPYDVTTDVGGYREQFRSGAFEDASDVKLFYGHSEPIGRIIAGRDTEEGYEIEARISKTPRGDEVYTLVRDGVLNKFSVGFQPIEHEMDEGVVVRTKAKLREVSIVSFPAYQSADLKEVRTETAVRAATANEIKKEVSNETIDMTDNVVNYDDAEIRSRIDVVERELAVVRENGVSNNSESASLFRSAGEWGLAVIHGDPKAQEERALVVSDDSHFSNDWRGGIVTVIERGRPLVNLFEKNTIANGHKTFEFLKALTGSGAVAVQSAEGATIANLSGSVTTDTGELKTYAGYFDVSVQTEDLTDVNLVDGLIRYAAESYAKATNDRLRAVLAAAAAQAGAGFTLSSATAEDYLNTITDAAQKIDANGTLSRSVDVIVVSTDVFNNMASLVDTTGRPVFAVNGAAGSTVNGIGSVNPAGLSLNIAGLPVVWESGLSAKTLYVASKSAVGSWENAGAPRDLRGVNVTALTKQYALYGYYEAKVKDEKGLVKAAIA